MKYMTSIRLIIFTVGSYLASGHCIAKDIDVGKIFVESLVEGALEDGCGDKANVHRMMGSVNESVRKQGYACFGVKQAEKINGRMKGKQTKKESACRNDNGKIICSVWVPESKINGEIIPAGFREIEMGK